MKNLLAVCASAVALAGCAGFEAGYEEFIGSLDTPASWHVRRFPSDGVHGAEPRFRQFPADPVFSGEQVVVVRPSVAERRSPVMRMRGLYRNGADGPRFTDCNTDRSYPVTAEGDREGLDAIGKAASGQSGTLQISVDARVVLRPAVRGSDVEQALLVEKFQALLPGSNCLVAAR